MNIEQPMKLLLIHNFYGSSAPSGENMVFAAEAELLRQHGHTVMDLTRHSDEIRSKGLPGAIHGALTTPWNHFVKRDVLRIVEKERPDIMHVHNTFPLISPSLFYAARNRVATVMTLHNYRLFCPAAILMRHGTACTECIDKKSVLPALKYGCYRNSRLATVPLAINVAVHRLLKTWRDKVDAFIALTEFQRQMLVQAGLSPDLIHVKPHFYPDPPLPLPWSEREQKAVFIGRLGPEKGINLLINAWKKWGSDAPDLEIIGDGSERGALVKLAGESSNKNKIVFRGQISFEETQIQLAKSRILLLPSICFEGFPMVIREAFALGVPVAASRIGALPDIVDEGKNGVLFAPGSSDDLLNVVKREWQESKLQAMAKGAREKFDHEYSATTNYEMLMNIYRKAMAQRRR